MQLCIAMDQAPAIPCPEAWCPPLKAHAWWEMHNTTIHFTSECIPAIGLGVEANHVGLAVETQVQLPFLGVGGNPEYAGEEICCFPPLVLI